MKAVLFKNNKKDSDRHPDMRGNLEITEEFVTLVNNSAIGDKLSLSAWLNTAQTSGEKYYSIQFSEPYHKQDTAPIQKKEYANPDEDLPF